MMPRTAPFAATLPSTGKWRKIGFWSQKACDQGAQQMAKPIYKRSITRKNNSMRSSQRGMRWGGCAAPLGAEDEPEAGSDAGTDMGAGLTVSVDDDDSGCWCIRLLLPAVPDVL